MAKIDNLPGVRVTIQVDGKSLKEYPDPDVDEDDDTVTRFIEAGSDQVFEIKCEAKKGTQMHGDSLTFEVLIDGQRLGSTVICRKSRVQKDVTDVIKGDHCSNGFLRKYCFSALEIASDNRAFRGEEQRLQDLGCIVVHVYHSRFSHEGEVFPDLRSNQMVDSESVDKKIISEKAIKGRSLSHSVGLLKTGKQAMWAGYSNYYTPLTNDPVGIFKFQYRSLECLKAMHLVPRTPTPKPLDERDAATLSLQDIMELQRRSRATQNETQAGVRAKRERPDDNHRPRKRARPHAGDTQIEFNEDGSYREVTTSSLGRVVHETIELD